MHDLGFAISVAVTLFFVLGAFLVARATVRSRRPNFAPDTGGDIGLFSGTGDGHQDASCGSHGGFDGGSADCGGSDGGGAH